MGILGTGPLTSLPTKNPEDLELIKPAQVKSPISPDLLNQVDVRFGTILSVTHIPNSEKLVALEVSFGDHKRTVLAGINSVPILAKSKANRLFSFVNLALRQMAGMT
jgi:tRNA-binding protein